MREKLERYERWLPWIGGGLDRGSIRHIEVESMTVCEARKLLEQFAPNAEVWLSVTEHDPFWGYELTTNHRLAGIRKEGQLVFLDGAEVEQ